LYPCTASPAGVIHSFGDNVNPARRRRLACKSLTGMAFFAVIVGFPDALQKPVLALHRALVWWHRTSRAGVTEDPA